MNYELSYRIFSLGDSAITIDFGNVIDEAINKHVLALFHQLQQFPLPGMIEVIPAYSSISILYDTFSLNHKIPLGTTVSEWMIAETKKILHQPIEINQKPATVFKIPVCYDEEFGVDLPQIIEDKKLSKEEIIRLHCEKKYRVYMLGFLPGFPYMGEVNERIAIPRKSQPQPVATGSVGIAGRQTGIYTVASPGGWSVIGRTPLKLFDAKKEKPALLNAGDAVEFYSISKEEFLKMQL